MPFDMILLGSLGTAFLIGFPAMFSIVNPVGNALTFLNVTSGRSHAERALLARRIGLYSLVVLLGSICLGAHLLAFFGISIGALRVAGGMTVVLQAWAMLMAPDLAPAKAIGRDTRQPDVAFFPLTMPFTTGPGAIAVAITLGAQQAPADSQLWFMAGIVLAASSIAALVWAIYASADRLARLLGNAGQRVLGRLVAFLLLCIGVQMIWGGIEDLLRPWLGAAAA